MDASVIESALQLAFAIQLGVFGIAHLLRPGPLIQFYEVLTAKGAAGVVFIALLSLVTGSLLVAFHNVWSGLPILLTLFGWAQLVKGIAYLLFPAVALRQFQKVTPERTNQFRLPGIPLLVISGLLLWHLWANR
jgi:uncharacterized protein YjeT (DUF2065 family)